MSLQGIYLIRNKINNKEYIGSSVNCTYRWAQHLETLQQTKHHNDKLQADFIEYGYSNFTFEVLELVSDKEKLLTREGYYIETHQSYKVDIGYNNLINHNPLTEARKKDEKLKKLHIKDDVALDEFNYCDSISEELRIKMKNNLNIFELKDINKFKNNDYPETMTKSCFCKSWFSKKDSNNIDLTKKVLLNYFRRINKDENRIWTTYISYKNEVKGKGFTKGFREINYISDKKYTNLAFVMNIYMNTMIDSDLANTKVNNERLALSVLLRWLVNNADIDNGATVFIPSKRMSDLLINYLNS